MKKIVRLTESDLTRLVKKVINKGTNDDVFYAKKIMLMIDNFHITCDSAVKDVTKEYDEIIRELESDEKILSHSRSYSLLNDILGNFMHYMVGEVQSTLESDNEMVDKSYRQLRDIIKNHSSEEDEYN